MSVVRPSPSAFTLSHLPVIQLATFDGKASDWESFRDRFTAVIIENKELHDFARMHYLLSSLRGRALECISDLAVTADNFTPAWHTLKNRFDNKRRLIAVHMSTLLALPRLNRESAVELQSLTSKVNLTLASLANLNRTPDDLWSDILVHIVTQQLDTATRRAWALHMPDSSEPHTFAALKRFLSERIHALEDMARDPPRAPPPRHTETSRVHNANVSAPSAASCPICHARHYFSSCPRFLGAQGKQRRDLVKKHRRCFNCLSPKHAVSHCESKYSCRECHKKHHSLLHDACESDTRPSAEAAPLNTLLAANSQNEVNSLFASTQAARRVPVLLATAQVRVQSTNGRIARVRALLDQGSEITLVSERLVQLLRAKHLRSFTSIRAVGCVDAGRVRYAVELSISPSTSAAPAFATTAIALPSLTSYAPRLSVDLVEFAHLSGLTWADPNPYSCDPIDIIIGSDLYGEVLGDGVRRGAAGQPIAQLTAFGWIISGPIGNAGSDLSTSRPSTDVSSSLDVLSSYHCHESLETEIKRFWELESIPVYSLRTPEDERCESHFAATHSRSPEGRYCVRIPFKRDGAVDIGSSRGRAAQSLCSLARRLRRDPSSRQAYIDFLRDYESLGHMRRVIDLPTSLQQAVYIPHHPVFRDRTSVRVVFNASSVTSNGTCLNDHILTGPKLQSDLSAVILRWRNFQFVYCADIAKMYRQILVDTRDVDYQRILWSESDAESPDEFQLLTVTYGMACAPFLALRVIQQLREDEGHGFPVAAQILRDHIYVDDVLFGGDTRDGALLARDQLVALLKRGCFPLRKWSSNAPSLLADLPADHCGITSVRDFDRSDQVKVLGIAWLPTEDVFCFNVVLPDHLPSTKRSILSLVSKLFDPLGWVTPVTISAKIFIQSLWRCKLSWDENLPSDIMAQWSRVFQALSQLRGLVIPRWTGFVKNTTQIELHGFADASNSAYAAVVFCKITSSPQDVSITLLTSKSRVAPIKPLSVPRLELCAAVTLARLLEFVRSTLSLNTARCYCWSDSRVVLHWLSKHPCQWKVFVSHRVHDIQTRIPDALWRHVPSSDNPADCASRGLYENELRSHHLWWHGPPWLAKPESSWPDTLTPFSEDLSLEEKVVSLHAEHTVAPIELFARFSSWPRMIRVLAYIHRFISACRKVHPPDSVSCINNISLSAAECSASRIRLLKYLQQALFPSEIRLLTNNQTLPAKNAILSLSPFVDEDGLLRVGGRISRAPFPFCRRHPVLLSHHPWTDLIIDHAHLRALHAGIQLTLNVVRHDFWIVRARSAVRHRLHQCVVCTRERAAVTTQYMCDLPRYRVNAPARPFSHVGIDYAGPLLVRGSAGRGSKSKKSYIALFICLATRAIHLELVSDYSAPTFLNAFFRFSARRGLPHTIYSDNGTTFVGADKELTLAYRSAIRDPQFLSHIATDKVLWKFIPPSAPHFGGLWEAGVKSVKYHLRRVIKTYTLTIEELSTLLCRIEACVNSRPLAPLSDSLEEYEPLTPGHFLIGSALTSHPEPSLLDVSENRLTRWQLVRQMTERFWHFWYNDYVNVLQQRSKWKQGKPPIKVGQMVLIRNSKLPPCKWELGRVSQCHPGPDGLIRVVTIKTASSELLRPIVRLCILPIDCE